VQYRTFDFALILLITKQGLVFGAFLGVGSRKLDIYGKDQTVPLRIFGWILAAAVTPHILPKSNTGPAFNFSLAYKL